MNCKMVFQQSVRRWPRFAPALLLAPAALLLSSSAPAAEKSVPIPAAKLLPGQVLRYALTLRTSAKSTRETVIQDSPSSSDLELSFSAVLRLEVLPAAQPPSVLRLRVTYERVDASQPAVAPEDAAGADYGLARRLAALQGKTFDCILAADGEGECAGESGIWPAAARGLRGWLASLFGPRGIPPRPLKPGAHWQDAREAGAEIPLRDLRWRRRFTFSGSEPCLAAAGSPSQRCAIIRMTSLLRRKGNPKDATPDAFRRRGLRASGTAAGSGESTLRISLATGLVVSLSESARQTSDVTVASASGANRVRTRGEINSESSLTLLPDSR